jgi:hypothetical protein
LSSKLSKTAVKTNNRCSVLPTDHETYSNNIKDKLQAEAVPSFVTYHQSNICPVLPAIKKLALGGGASLPQPLPRFKCNGTCEEGLITRLRRRIET